MKHEANHRLIWTTSCSLGRLSPVFVWYILSAGGGRGPYTAGPGNELGHPTAAHEPKAPLNQAGRTHQPPPTTPPPSITTSTPCNAQYKALIQAIQYTPLHCMPSPMKTPGGVHAPNSTLKYHRGPDPTRTDTVQQHRTQHQDLPTPVLPQCLNSI